MEEVVVAGAAPDAFIGRQPLRRVLHVEGLLLIADDVPAALEDANCVEVGLLREVDQGLLQRVNHDFLLFVDLRQDGACHVVIDRHATMTAVIKDNGSQISFCRDLLEDIVKLARSRAREVELLHVLGIQRFKACFGVGPAFDVFRRTVQVVHLFEEGFFSVLQTAFCARVIADGHGDLVQFLVRLRLLDGGLGLRHFSNFYADAEQAID